MKLKKREAIAVKQKVLRAGIPIKNPQQKVRI